MWKSELKQNILLAAGGKILGTPLYYLSVGMRVVGMSGSFLLSFLPFESLGATETTEMSCLLINSTQISNYEFTTHWYQLITFQLIFAKTMEGLLTG